MKKFINDYFEETVLKLFEFLQDQGFKSEAFQECRAVSYVNYRKGALKISVCYEPWGPPWLFVVDEYNDRVISQIKPNVGNNAANQLACTESSDDRLIEIHKSATLKWLELAKLELIENIEKYSQQINPTDKDWVE